MIWSVVSNKNMKTRATRFCDDVSISSPVKYYIKICFSFCSTGNDNFQPPQKLPTFRWLRSWTDQNIRLLKRKSQTHEQWTTFVYARKKECFLPNQRSWFTSSIWNYLVQVQYHVVLPPEKVRFRYKMWHKTIELIKVERNIWFSIRFSSLMPRTGVKCKHMSDVWWC